MEAEDHQPAVPDQLDEGRQQDAGGGAACTQQASAAQILRDDGPVVRRELEAARSGPSADLLLHHGITVSMHRYNATTIARMAPARYSGSRNSRSASMSATSICAFCSLPA